MLTKIKIYFPDIELKGNKVIFYHGTPSYNLDQILDEGLKGGDNKTGGNRGVWKNAILFCTPSKYVAEKYGEVITITMPFKEFLEKNFDVFNDGLGDKTYSLESEDFDEILIDSKYLSQNER